MKRCSLTSDLKIPPTNDLRDTESQNQYCKPSSGVVGISRDHIGYSPMNRKWQVRQILNSTQDNRPLLFLQFNHIHIRRFPNCTFLQYTLFPPQLFPIRTKMNELKKGVYCPSTNTP